MGESQPSALDILRSTVARVDTLAAAVGTLCAHMESLRVKEVAALAEARVHEVCRSHLQHMFSPLGVVAAHLHAAGAFAWTG